MSLLPLGLHCTCCICVWASLLLWLLAPFYATATPDNDAYSVPLNKYWGISSAATAPHKPTLGQGACYTALPTCAVHVHE